MSGFFTLDTVPIVIVTIVVILEIILMLFRHKNDPKSLIPRDYGVHIVMIIQAGSMALSLSGLELAVAGSVTDRIRVVSTVGGLVLFVVGVITYLNVVIDDYGS